MKKESFQEFLSTINSSDMPITPCSLCRKPQQNSNSPLIFQWIKSFTAIGVALLFLLGGLAGLLLYLLTDRTDTVSYDVPPAITNQLNTVDNE